MKQIDWLHWNSFQYFASSIVSLPKSNILMRICSMWEVQVPFQLGKSVNALKKLLIFLFIQFLCFLYFIGQATNEDIRNNNRTHQVASLSVVPLLGNIYICLYLFACVIFLSVLPFVVFHVQMEPYSLVLDTNPGQTLWWRLSKTTARFLSSQCVVVENFKDCSQNCWIEEAQNIFLPMSSYF